MLKWFLLALAIVFEVFATMMVKASDGFTRLWPTLGVFAGYGLSFYLDSLVVKLGMPLSITYAIWSAVGLTLVAVCAWILYDERLNTTATIGMVIIIIGVTITSIGGAGGH